MYAKKLEGLEPKKICEHLCAPYNQCSVMIKHNFQVKAIDASEIQHLFALDDDALRLLGAKRMIVHGKPGYPCRVSLQDAEMGEEVLLFPYRHHDVASPYQSSGPIFVRKGGMTADLPMNEIPLMLHHRLLSIRAYDAEGTMRDAKTVEGKHLVDVFATLFTNTTVHYLHLHNAGPGCYNCCVERVLAR